MEDTLSLSVSSCQRLIKKMENYQKMLNVRKDDLIGENAELHSQLKRQLTEHEEFVNTHIGKKFSDISGEYAQLLKEAQQRLDLLYAVKRTGNFDQFADQINEIVIKNDEIQQNRALFSYDNILQLQLNKMSSLWESFTRALRENKVLKVSAEKEVSWTNGHASVNDGSGQKLKLVSLTGNYGLVGVSMAIMVQKVEQMYDYNAAELNRETTRLFAINETGSANEKLALTLTQSSLINALMFDFVPRSVSSYRIECFYNNKLLPNCSLLIQVFGHDSIEPLATDEPAQSSVISKTEPVANGYTSTHPPPPSIQSEPIPHRDPYDFLKSPQMPTPVAYRPPMYGCADAGRGSFKSMGGYGRSQMNDYLKTPGSNVFVPVPQKPTSSASSQNVSTADADLTRQFEDLVVGDTNPMPVRKNERIKTEVVHEEESSFMSATSHSNGPVSAVSKSSIKSEANSTTNEETSFEVASQRMNVADEQMPATSNKPPQITTPIATSANTVHKRFDLSRILNKSGTGRGPIQGKIVLKLGSPRRSEPVESFFKFPIGCTKNEFTGDYIVCDTKHDAVKMYAADGRPKLMINGAENPSLCFSNPSAVVVLDANTFIVKDDFALFAFDCSGKLLNVAKGNFKKLYGLNLNEKGNLVTLDLHARPDSLVYEVDPYTGKILSQYPFTAHRQTPNSKCRFMDYNAGRLMVVDLGGNKVHACDQNGNLQFSFGERSRGAREPGFNEPSGIAMDVNGVMLIGDSRNDRVQVWSAEGGHLCNVTFDDRIVRPSNIHLTEDGHLMVMNYIEHYVSIFKLF